jgi:hypothetical protein
MVTVGQKWSSSYNLIIPSTFVQGFYQLQDDICMSQKQDWINNNIPSWG